MKKITKLFLAFVMAMGALSVFAADHCSKVVKKVY